MADRILFIGAGASYGARLNQTRQPPLGTQLCHWLRDVSPRFLKELGLIDLHSEIQSAIDLLNKHTHEDIYEVLVSRLDRDDRVTLNRLLLITFSDISERRKYGDLSSFDEGFRNQQDGYDHLLDALNFKNDPWSIVSLNYDLLIEEAMRRNSIPFFYPHFRFNHKEDQSGLTGVKIFKPHGSINFFAHGDYRISHGEPSPSDDRGEPAGFYQDSMGAVTVTFPIVMATPPGAENVLHIANFATISEPVIANYTKGKASDTNQETLENVRRDVLTAFKKASEAVIIGVKPIRDEADDNFVAEVLKSLPQKVIFVSANRDECRLIKELYPMAQTFSGGIDEFLHSRSSHT